MQNQATKNQSTTIIKRVRTTQYIVDVHFNPDNAEPVRNKIRQITPDLLPSTASFWTLETSMNANPAYSKIKNNGQKVIILDGEVAQFFEPPQFF